MTRSEVQIGHVYLAKVSGKICRVRIDKEIPGNSWAKRQTTHYRATNLSTGREIRIRSAAKLRIETKEEAHQ